MCIGNREINHVLHPRLHPFQRSKSHDQLDAKAVARGADVMRQTLAGGQTIFMAWNGSSILNRRSPDDYRPLLCDGHDSHISADFVSFCIHNRIDLIPLPPHSSHLLQPSYIGVFAPLKARHLHSNIEEITRNEGD